jgi:8-oxo-dGTP pyrophosphatase MutT (NUDIX family)
LVLLLSERSLREYPETCYQFLIEGYPGVFGYLIESTVQAFSWTEHFVVDHEHRSVKLLGDSLTLRSSRAEELLLIAKENDTFKVLRKWTKTPFPVYGPGRELVLNVDRCAIPLFGFPTYASHLSVYREDEDGLFIWAARRAPSKSLYPNKLGVTVAGGIQSGETPFECIIREAYEEASLPTDLTRNKARSAGVVTYVTTTDASSISNSDPGLIRAEVQFQYEMKVGPDVVPTVNDGEASDISLYSLDDVKRAIDEGDFTPGNACFILDFFIRHGLVTPENELNYAEIVRRLHRSIGVHTA